MIPNDLIAFPQWLNWRYETVDGKPTKVPYNPVSGYKAAVTNPDHLVGYDVAVKALDTGYYNGVGFALLVTDPFCFIDLDDPGGDFAIIERHNKILKMFDSYTEWSPSGKGMHIIVRGMVPDGRRRSKVEVYSHARYMTVTGNTYLDKPIVNRMDILPAFHAELGKPTVLSVVRDTPQTLSDWEVYEKMMAAANGDKVLQTWNGEFEGLYPSHSECDQALINFIQFYTHNALQIERMFRSSPCANRLVTGEKIKWKNYIPLMIQKSFDRELPEIDFTALRLVAAKPPVFPAVDALQLVPKAPKLDLKTPPGLVGEIMTYLYEQAPLPVAEVALAGALGMMAGICGRSYNVSDEGLNMYLLILALTGTGKEAAAKGIDKLMSKVKTTVPAADAFRGPAEIASGPAITKFLKDHPCCFSILGEFGLRLHQMCADQAQSHMVGLRRVLLDLFHKSGKGGEIQPHIYSEKDKNTDVLYSPAFTILGESTPATFYSHLDESMIADGLLPRFLCLEYTGDRVMLSRTFKHVEPPAILVQKVAELCTYATQMHHNNRVLPCMLTPEAETASWALSDRYTTLINENRDNEIARQLYNRAHIKVMKLAALVSVGINPMYPTITVDLIEWGVTLVDTDIQNILHRFQAGRIGRETGDINQTTEMIKIFKDYMDRPYDKTMEKYRVPPEMKTANVVPYTYIQRQCASRAPFRSDRLGSTAAITRALQTLVYEGAIREVKSHVMLTEFNASMRAFAIIDPAQFV